MLQLQDDSAEHRLRSLWSWSLGPPVGILWGFYAYGTAVQSLAWWVASSTLMLLCACSIYCAVPTPARKLGTQSRDRVPQPTRPGNPILRQRSPGCSLVLGAFLASLVGCSGLVYTSDNDSLLGLSLMMMYLSLALLATIFALEARWLELDVETLQVLQHRVLFGLRRTRLITSTAMKALAACRTATLSGHSVFAFTLDGEALPLCSESNNLKEIQFEAERLADQLMVPLLVGLENHTNYEIANRLRHHKPDLLSQRQDWTPTEMPCELQVYRSILPPQN